MPIVRLSKISKSELRPYQGTKDAELCTFKGKGHNYGLFVAESKNVIERAWKSGCGLQSLLVEDSWAHHERQLIDQVLDVCPEAPVIVVSHEEFQQVTGYETTRGALACFARPAPANLDALLNGTRRVAVLEDITNYTNIGAIFRSAAALNIDAVLLTPSCHDPLFRRASRVSMGTVFQVPWAHLSKGEDAGELLRAYGFKTVALALRENALPVDDATLKQEPRLALFLGTEGDGLKDSTITASDYSVIIPMRDGVDSLNVAAASAVAFWELRVR